MCIRENPRNGASSEIATPNLRFIDKRLGLGGSDLDRSPLGLDRTWL